MFKNIKFLFSSLYRSIAYLLLVGGLGILWWYTTDIRIMFGNYGNIHTYTDLVFTGIIMLVFPLFIIAFIYRSWKYGKRTDIDRKSIN